MKRGCWIAGAMAIGGLATRVEASPIASRRLLLAEPGNTRNLVPDSEFLNKWPNTSLFTFAPGMGFNGSNAIALTGTGASVGGGMNTSPAIYVVPNTTYTLSGYINSTTYNASNYLRVSMTQNNGGGGTNLELLQAEGLVNGRLKGTFSTGSYGGKAYVFPYVSTQTVTSGAVIYWSQFCLQLGATNGLYVPSVPL